MHYIDIDKSLNSLTELCRGFLLFIVLCPVFVIVGTDSHSVALEIKIPYPYPYLGIIPKRNSFFSASLGTMYFITIACATKPGGVSRSFFFNWVSCLLKYMDIVHGNLFSLQDRTQYISIFSGQTSSLGLEDLLSILLRAEGRSL